MNNNFLPYDVYERHRKVGSIIKDKQSVLDVGGELNHLSKFSNPKRLVVANLESGDVIIHRDRLPFPKNSFDIVTAIDVLEHIPKEKRITFINSLISVAKKSVILSFPIGTEHHIDFEKETQKWLIKNGKDVKYLTEHIRYGLPTKKEILKFTDLNTQLSYSGNIEVNKLLFRIFLFDPQIKVLRRLIYMVKLLFNFVTNNLFYFLLIDKKYSENVNRAYLIIYKRSKKQK